MISVDKLLILNGNEAPYKNNIRGYIIKVPDRHLLLFLPEDLIRNKSTLNRRMQNGHGLQVVQS